MCSRAGSTSKESPPHPPKKTKPKQNKLSPQRKVSHPAQDMYEVAARLDSFAQPLNTFSQLMVLHVATCRNLSFLVVSTGLVATEKMLMNTSSAQNAASGLEQHWSTEQLLRTFMEAHYEAKLPFTSPVAQIQVMLMGSSHFCLMYQ